MYFKKIIDLRTSATRMVIKIITTAINEMGYASCRVKYWCVEIEKLQLRKLSFDLTAYKMFDCVNRWLCSLVSLRKMSLDAEIKYKSGVRDFY